MAEALVGNTTRRDYRVTAKGAPQTGLVPLYSLWNYAGTQLVTAQNMTEDTALPGVYFYLPTGANIATPGFYRERVTTTTSLGTWQEDRFFRAVYPGADIKARWELRHMVAQLLGDLLLGVATGGTTTTLIDSERIEGNDFCRGAWVCVYAGTNRGIERKVSTFANAFSSGTATLTFGTAAPNAYDTTSYYELHKRFSVDEYNRAINTALGWHGDQFLIPVEDESIAQVDSQLEYQVTLPFFALQQVWSGNATDGFTQLLKSDWSVIPGRRLLRVASADSTNNFRLVGQIRPQPMVSDDSYTDIDANYLALRAAAILAGDHIKQQDRESAAQVSQFYHAQAEAIKPTSMLLPGSRIIR
jgi:hypothetical protein